MDSISDVVIDSDGVFKYILIEVSEGSKTDNSSKSKMIVRGFEWAEFHADILDRVSPKFHEMGLKYECLGGGRIRHDSQQQKIEIFGYSVGFGQADHAKTQQLLYHQYNYPEGNITWSNAGY